MQPAMAGIKGQRFMSNFQGQLLLVEDDVSIGEGLKFNFEHEGFLVHWHTNGQEALHFVKEHHLDLAVIILDVMLPVVDGIEILRSVRTFAEQIPIIVLSAKSLEKDKVIALELGADDYVTKPFSLVELILRIKGLAKRRQWYRQNVSHQVLKMGDAQVDLVSLMAKDWNGEAVRLSPTEGLLLKVFHENENVILSRQDLLNAVWQYESAVETRTVDVFIGRIRKLLEINPSKPHSILSVRGVGYAYVTDNAFRLQLQSAK
jgi:DNA-binding response OmpR family regulator